MLRLFNPLAKLALVLSLLVIGVSSHADAVTRPDVYVLMIAGMNSQGTKPSQHNDNYFGGLSGEIQVSLEQYGYSASDAESRILYLSYSGNYFSGPNLYSHPNYTNGDVCVNGSSAFTNIQSIFEAHPDSNFILVGHSLGGLVVKSEMAAGFTRQVVGAIAIDSMVQDGIGGLPALVNFFGKFHCGGNDRALQDIATGDSIVDPGT